MGRPVTGMQGYSDAGDIPPVPGWVFSLSSIYYDGSISRGREVPVLGNVSGGISPTVSYTIVNLTRTWGGDKGGISYASSLGLPLQSTKVRADFKALGPGVSTTDESTDLADILVTPIIASYRIAEGESFSFSLPIYAPTGEYDPQRLANAGQNVWTVMPTLAYSKLDGKGSEFTSMAAIEVYSKNEDTDYQSGALFRVDVLWLTPLSKPGWAMGLAGGWIQQLQDDNGTLADRLGGFHGSSLGAGPQLGWGGKFGKQAVAVSARWVPEFYARNRPRGNGFSVDLTLPFF